jgi:hypothetical protein
MTAFTDTNLWIRTLGEGAEDERPGIRESRELLHAAFINFRDRARMLAAEIPRDLPDFTVHDVSHLDALWGMAELVAGSDYPLNPMEAFVLGGAFLVHDLGMGAAAYPEGMEALRNQEIWRDTVASLWRSEFGELPTPEEVANPPVNIERAAVAEMLRVLHAERAEQLAFISWRVEGGETYHLIENVELRSELGPIIGRLAHSHWWPVERLRDEFSTKSFRQ